MYPLISKLCTDLSFTNFGTVGQCVVETTMFGDLALGGLILFVLFTALIVKNNFPLATILPLGTAVTYALMLLTPGEPIFIGLFILSLIISGGLLVIGLLAYINR